MAVQYRMKAPLDIWMAYGGDRQAIARAMELNIIRPDEGVLAVMEGERYSQMPAQAPQATVAQQVMGGVPPVPANPLPAGGLGSPAPAAPPMTPPMGMAPPMPMPEAPPMGMADGGLAMLPVPDAMFDEPTNGGFDDGYAGGGIVAFADGGSALGPWFEEQAAAAIPGIVVTSRQRSAAKNKEVGGTPDSYHLTDNARDFVPPKGMDMGSLASKLKSLYGAGFDVINEGDHVHVEPGPKGSRTAVSTPRNADINTSQGRAVSLEDSILLGRELLSGGPREELERARAYALEELDPANQEKARKADMWQALAEMGFRMASSSSPFVLQAIGEAAVATLPGVDASKKERKAAKDNAIRTLMAVEDVDRKTATAGVELGVDIYKTGLSQEQIEQQMANEQERIAISRQSAADQAAYQRGSLTLQREQIEAGKTGLQSYANAIYAQLKDRNNQGVLTDPQGRKYPYKLADSELRAMAMNAAAKALAATRAAADANPLGLPDTAGGGGAGAPVVLDPM